MAFLTAVSFSRIICRTISSQKSLLTACASSTTTTTNRSLLDKDVNFLRPPCLTVIPDRGAKFTLKTVKRRRTRPWKHLATKSASRHDAFLDKENHAFLDELVQQERDAGSPLNQTVIQSQTRPFKPDSRRIGLIGRKIGILPYWTKDGVRGLNTIIQVVDNHVIKSYSSEEYAKIVIRQNRWRSEGSACVVVGAESTDPREVSAEYAGLFEEAGVLPKKRLTNMFVSDDATLVPGTPLTVSHFRVGDYVDVFGKTIDRGFQGVMTRWQFKGMPDRNTTKAHRRGGSIASGRRMAGPLKGRKMPGHMGSERRGMVGVRIFRIDHENQCIFVQGPAVPGAIGSWCLIYDSRILEKRPTVEKPPPFPTAFADRLKPADADGESAKADDFYEKIHQPSDATIVFQEDESEKKTVRTGAKLAKVRAKK